MATPTPQEIIARSSAAPAELAAQPAVLRLETTQGFPITYGYDTGILIDITGLATVAVVQGWPYVIEKFGWNFRNPELRVNGPEFVDWMIQGRAPAPPLPDNRPRNLHAYAVDISKPWPWPRFKVTQIVLSGGDFQDLLLFD